MTVCLTAPQAGASLVGTSTVSVSITESAGSPGVRRGVFTINGNPLLTDFTAPYTFSLDSRRWGDGSYVIGANVVMRDNFVSTVASATVTFANNQTSGQPNTNQFVPTAGTPPASGAPLVLAAVGDGADGGTGASSTVGLISSWNPNLFMYLGDVYEDGTAMEFNNWYGQGGTGGLYGQLRNITNPVIGNHEYVGHDASGYFYYWDNIPHYYSYNSHGWHFIALDSTSQFGQTAPGTGQYNWLAADLAANTSPCTVVYYHHPLLNVGPEGQSVAMASMWQLFAQYHVTLVLNGHDHDYQRFTPVDGNLNPSPIGVTEIIVGSGGHGTQNQVTTDQRLVASDFADFGALKLNLFDTSATFQFQTTNGAVVDSGLIPCRNTSDSTPPTTPGNVTATANGPGEIDVAWSASTDNVGVAGYDVFKDGSNVPVATLASDARSYSDTVVAPNSTHSYTVVAFDAASNRSCPGGPASATTPEGAVNRVLTPVADTYVNSDSPTSNFGGATVLRVASPSGTSTATMNSYLRFDLSNVVGRIQSASLGVMANSSSGVGFSVAGVTNTTWDEYATNYSNAPTAGPIVGTSGGLVAGSRSSVDVSGLAAAAQGGRLSVQLTKVGSQASLASRETATPPQLTIVIASGSGAPPVASFTSSATTTSVGVAVGFTDTSTGNPTSWSWAFGDGATSNQQTPTHAWAAAGTYTVSLVASNLYGPSAPATAQITVSADTQPPTVPGNVTATAAGASAIDVSWSAATDNVGVTGYDVYRDGSSTPVGTVGGSTVTFRDTALGTGTTHTYTVDAFDAAGNHSALSSPPASATTASNQTYVLSPVADTYVDSANPTTNYGSNTALRTKNSSGLIMNAYLRFDLSSVVGTVQSATLTVVPTSSTTFKTQAGGVADTTWGESSVNYTTAPAIGAPVSSSGAITAGTPVNFNVASLVTPAQGGLLSIGLTGTGTQTAFASKEATTTSSRPTLTIVMAP